MSIEQIEKIVREAVEDVAGIQSLQNDISLVDRSLAIPPACFLYIFDIIESKTKLPVYDILKNSNHEVMTIRNMTTALYELETRPR